MSRELQQQKAFQVPVCAVITGLSHQRAKRIQIYMLLPRGHEKIWKNSIRRIQSTKLQKLGRRMGIQLVTHRSISEWWVGEEVSSFPDHHRGGGALLSYARHYCETMRAITPSQDRLREEMREKR